MTDVSAPYLETKIICQICSELPILPVLICSRGHYTCDFCSQRQKTCSTCRSPFCGRSDTLAEAEQMLNERDKQKSVPYLHRPRRSPVTIVRRYNSAFGAGDSDGGAKQQTKPINFGLSTPQHSVVNKVGYGGIASRSFPCNLIGINHNCVNQRVSLPKLKEHLKTGHGLQGVSANSAKWVEFFSENMLQTQLSRRTIYSYMDVFDNLFLAASELQAGTFFWWIYLVDADTDQEEAAEKFYAEISICNAESKTQLSWNGPVHSYNKTPQSIFRSGLALMAGPDNVCTFASEAAHAPPKNIKMFKWTITYKVNKK